MVKVNYIHICIMSLKLTWQLTMNSLKATLAFVAKLVAAVSF